MGGKRLTKDELEKIVKMRNDGNNVQQIANDLGRSYMFVSNALKKADFTPTRKPNEAVVIENPTGNIIDNFTPLYKRIKYLNEQKEKIDEELLNIRATLQNAIEIIDTGDLAKPVRTWGAIRNDYCTDD